ncbi:hypothetical protein ACV1DR_19315, partial [Aeromonas jandaei]
QSGLNQSKNRRLKTGLRDNYLEKRRYGASMAVVVLARCGGLSGSDGATHFSSLLCSRLSCTCPSLPASGAFLCVGSHPAAVYHLTNL